MKKWSIGKPDINISKKFISGSDLSSLCADVLVSRGIKDLKEAAELIRTEEPESPFEVKDMEKAVDIINEAVESGRKICIYGDYDCDGITSTVMIYSYLECLGADVSYYIPEREEGYGLNNYAIDKIAEDGTELIITVDNGISAIEEAKYIKECGMTLIITDHHQPGVTLPQADAIINPHRKDCNSEFKYLCGAGVVLKLIAALDGGDYEMALEQFGDLTAIGTVADIVSLTSENRFIVERGIQLIKNTENCGLIALMKVAGLIDEDGEYKNVTSNDIAFMIAPRINAAGRFGSPTLAVRLLLCDDPDEAEELAEELNRLNTERKAEEQKITNCIFDVINENPSMLAERVLVFSGDGWHHGVIGIVASKMLERFGKPCFIITQEGEMSRGSARAFGEFSVFECLTSCTELLEKFGGHQGAGGFSLRTSDVSAFTDAIQKYALEKHEVMPVLTIHAEKLLLPQDITLKNIEGLSILEPFGEGNRQPVFALAGAVIQDIFPLSSGVHTKLILNYGGAVLSAVLFRLKIENAPFKKGEKWDFITKLDINEYGGKRTISLNINDYRKSGINQESFFAAFCAYEKYMRKETLPQHYYKRMCPERDELVRVYSGIGENTNSVMSLYSKVGTSDLNFCKFKVCLDIFREMGLVNIDFSNDEIKKLKVTQKVNMENSNILRELQDKWGIKAVQ